MSDTESAPFATDGAGAQLHVIDCSPLLAERPGASSHIPQFSLSAPSAGELLHAVVDLRADRTNRGVRLVGSARGEQEGSCARCLRPARAPIETSIDEEVLEDRFTADEGERFGRGNTVDVGRIAIEGLDLVRHLVLHCDPICPERCGHCGGVHPTQECPQRDLDPRLAVLGRLLPPEDESGPRS